MITVFHNNIYDRLSQYSNLAAYAVFLFNLLLFIFFFAKAFNYDSISFRENHTAACFVYDETHDF